MLKTSKQKMDSQMFSPETEEKYTLITRDLQEVLGGNSLKEVLEKGTPTIYWGTAPTNSIHFGYVVQGLKLKDIVNAGAKLVILIADLHAFLDSSKSSLETVAFRAHYYEKMMRAILERLGVDLSKVTFVKGSDFQLSKEYTLDVYKMNSVATESQCKHAGSEVVKQSDNSPMTNLLYPSLQALDMIYLKADSFIGGIDQRKLNTFALDFLPKIGYKTRYTYLMTKMIGGIRTKRQYVEVVETKKVSSKIASKMSASDASSKIDLLSSPQVINKVISKAFFDDGNADDNSLLELMENLIFKLVEEFTVTKWKGESKTYTTYQELHDDVALGSINGGVHPADFKQSLTNFLVEYLKPIRDAFDNDESRELLKNAYGSA